MAELSFIVGIIGNVISILVFTSPIGTFKRVVKKKSTENFKWVPYTTTLLSTCLWSFYGLLKPGGLLVVTVNGTGSLMQAIYVLLFLFYAPKETRVKLAKTVGILNIGCFGVVVLITLLAIHGTVRLLVIGFLCGTVSVFMYASPMAAMGMVIRTKSVEYMPFSLSFFLCLNGGIWTIYAALVRDFFLGVPNAIGLVLGCTQLIVYAMYKGKQQPPKDIDVEDGSTHLVDVEKQEWDKGTQQEKQLSKGSSLPKPSVSRQHSLNKIVKSISLTSYELQSYWNQNTKSASEIKS